MIYRVYLQAPIYSHVLSDNKSKKDNMKIALAQINTIVGDLKGNSELILKYISKAQEQKVDLIVFPELAITGYPPKDLIERKWFVKKNLEYLAKISKSCRNIIAIVGFIDFATNKSGKKLYNSAAALKDGKIFSCHPKTLLPTYDVFDEGRYFDSAISNEPVELLGHKVGITICEDIWNDELYWGRFREYPRDPIAELSDKGVDMLINISASPFTLDKKEIKKEMFKNTVKRYNIPLIHVNLVGGNDSLVFDGWSFVMDKDGSIISQTADFEEDYVICDLESRKGEIHQCAEEKYERLFKALVLGLRDYAKKCGFKKAIIGLSGGIDSALVAVLAAEALGHKNVLGVSMPSRFSSEGSKSDSQELTENLGIDFKIIPIEKIFSAYLETLEPYFNGTPFNIAEENIQARIRGNILMALSNKFGYLVLSTGNKSELAVGYCTLYGDMSGGLAVISDVPKTMVYQLCEYINNRKKVIPEAIIKKLPSAELRPNQKDSDSLPEYDILDPIVKAYVEEHKAIDEIALASGLDKKFVSKIADMIDKNEYKRRQAPPGLKVTGKAFGEGWRMPIAKGIEN